MRPRPSARLRPLVRADVPLVVGVVAEAAAAVGAAVGFLPRVDPQVLLVAVEARQSFPADVARVRLVRLGPAHLAMHLRVLGPVGPLGEGAPADSADVGVHQVVPRNHTLDVGLERGAGQGVRLRVARVPQPRRRGGLLVAVPLASSAAAREEGELDVVVLLPLSRPRLLLLLLDGRSLGVTELGAPVLLLAER